MEHLIDSALLQRRVAVHLVGVGGNGAQMAASLARLDIAMRALGHPGGLHVTAFDGDTVSEANVGRQMYSPADVGQNKALLTIHRLNLFYGLDWGARPWRYDDAHDETSSPDIVVSCVDTRESRRALHRRIVKSHSGVRYWLDLGNTESTGQAVLGEGFGSGRNAGTDRLPCVTELFPQILLDSAAEDNTPSCSVRMSLASQGLFVNDVVVRFGVQLLYELFSQGRLTTHGVVINLGSKRTAPIDIDREVWRRFGYEGGEGSGRGRGRARSRR